MNIAIVTGASSGMGREFVLQLGAYTKVDEIWVIARRKEALESLQGQVSVPVRPICLDLCREDSFDKLHQMLLQEQPNVKLLVNAAGFGKMGGFSQIPLTEDLRMIDLNCKAVVAMTRVVFPYMRPGSHILQLDSLSAFQPVPYLAAYGATKSFVLSYTRACNHEIQGSGIRMMAMCPGWVKTEFFKHATVSDPDQKVTHFSFLAEPKEVVAAGLKKLYCSKKDHYVPVFGNRFQACLVKFLPHKLVMAVWCALQRHPKHNRELR